MTINQVDASGVVGDWQNLTISGQVAVTVENIGGTAVNSSFRVKVFEDASGNGIFDASEIVYGQKNMSGLAAGALVTVNVSVAGAVLFRNNLPIHAFLSIATIR
ncbi:MAG: hypothetical protein R3E58_01945 [Phycisphaerae bacterium]